MSFKSKKDKIISIIKYIRIACIRVINIYIYPIHTKYTKAYTPLNVKILIKNSQLNLKKPIFLEKTLHLAFQKKNTIHYESIFIAEIPQGYVWGNQGTVISDDNILFNAVSREYDQQGKNHSIFKQYRIVKPSVLNEKVAVIAASGADVYYHWMLDIIPRLILLQENGFLNSSLKIVINYNGLPFQKESLIKLGVDLNQIINADSHWNFHLKASLIVPSFTSPNDSPSAYSINAIRNQFLEKSTQKFRNSRIYIKRSKGRRILNEDEVLMLLKKYDFEIIEPELFSISSQAEIFNHASFIIGPHGAGFTNLIFCRENTKIIDIFSQEWVNHCYSIIASVNNLRYGYLLGEKVKQEQTGKGANIKVDISKLDALIQKMLI
jgi:capsular polysaccharide biosynthesis protein